jgi:hypothetical protein
MYNRCGTPFDALERMQSRPMSHEKNGGLDSGSKGGDEGVGVMCF